MSPKEKEVDERSSSTSNGEVRKKKGESIPSTRRGKGEVTTMTSKNSESDASVSEDKRSGPFYEDFKVGIVIRHPGGRTITDTDNIWFTLITCNTNQIHYNEEYTKRYFSNPPFDGRLVVNSFLVLSIMTGLSTESTSANGIMLGMKDWKVHNPTFAGDTITAESEVISKRESKSHPSMGIVTVKTRAHNQKGTIIMECERSFMTRKYSNAEWR